MLRIAFGIVVAVWLLTLPQLDAVEKIKSLFSTFIGLAVWFVQQLVTVTGTLL